MIEYKGQKAELTKNELKILYYPFLRTPEKSVPEMILWIFFGTISFMLMITP